MRTAAYNVGVASAPHRRKNVPRHILCSAGNELVHVYEKLVITVIGIRDGK